MQLVEVAFVAAMRAEGISLQKIRKARDYIAKHLEAEYPFASLRFKTDGQHILFDLEQVERIGGEGKLVVADQGGQIAWTRILGDKFTEFEYSDDLAVRWRLAGPESPIVIDPRIAFGAPAISGIPTWALKGRWAAGEREEDIADDFGLSRADVLLALKFEGHDAEAAALH